MAEIALVHYTAPPVIGGVERVLGRHAALLADDGHRVRIVAGRGSTPTPAVAFRSVPLADSQAPEIIAIRSELAAGRRTDAFSDLVERLRADLVTALEGIELFIVHNVASLDMNLALTEALYGLAEAGLAPFILWHHDLAWTRPADRSRLHDGPPWDRLRTSWPGAQPVVVSEARRSELATLLRADPATITVVPNGIDLPEPPGRPLPSGVAALATSADPLLVLPARIARRKNIELALRVLAALREGGHPAALLVTGPLDPHGGTTGEVAYLAELLALRDELDVEDAAWFAATTGEAPLDGPVIDVLYELADAMFLPSLDEGFGLPVLEAAARRLPIIAVLSACLLGALVPLVFTRVETQLTLSRMLVFAIVALSLTILTGWAGQLSLGQFAFVGLGAILSAALVRGMEFDIFGWHIELPTFDFEVAVIIAVVMSALFAMVVGIPALRIRGLFLAVTTLAALTTVAVSACELSAFTSAPAPETVTVLSVTAAVAPPCTTLTASVPPMTSDCLFG